MYTRTRGNVPWRLFGSSCISINWYPAQTRVVGWMLDQPTALICARLLSCRFSPQARLRDKNIISLPICHQKDRIAIGRLYHRRYPGLLLHRLKERVVTAIKLDHSMCSMTFKIGIIVASL